MKRIFALIIAFSAFCGLAEAQTKVMPAKIVPTCGASLGVSSGVPYFLTIDGTGSLCISGSLSLSATVGQGTPAAGSNAWPVSITDTTNTIVKPGDAANNAMRVNIVAGAGSGGTALGDKATFTAGVTNATPISGLFENSPTSCANNQACALGLTAAREAKVSVTQPLPGGSNVIGHVIVDSGTLTANQGGTWNIGTVTTVTGVTTVSAVTAITNALPAGANVIGQVTANAGTNLNTSLLALETGGNLAAAKADLDKFTFTGNNLNMNIAQDAISTAVGVTVTETPVYIGGINESTRTSISNNQKGAFHFTTDQVAMVTPTATADSTMAALPCYVKSGTGTLNDTTNHANCKSSAGNFYGARAINTTSTLAYLRMYNLAADPTCSSSTGFVESIPIPAQTGGSGYIDLTSALPFNYSTGISYCVTGLSANNDNTAPVAGVFVTLKYK